jgi:hypothetical protein
VPNNEHRAQIQQFINNSKQFYNMETQTPTVKTPLTKEEMINQLWEQYLVKKAEVEKALKPTYLTGGSFRFGEGTVSGGIDITTARDERKLVEIGAFLTERSNSYQAVAERLGCKVSFTWLGFTEDEWFTDLKTRVDSLQISKRRAELAEFETRLNKVMPQEMRDAKELESLAKML